MLEIRDKVQLYKGDCLEIMRDIPNKSIDMILCDLPYGTTQNKWDSVIPLDRLWKEYKRIIKDNGVIALTSQGIFTAKLMLSNEKWFKYKLVWEKSKATNFLNAKKQPLRKHEDICIFYNKQPIYNPQMTEGKPLHGKGSSYKTKDLTNNCYGSLGATEDVRKGSTEKYPTSIVRFQKPHPSCSVHPTQKSTELCEWLIRTYTNEGETVLDNCMGSGTTGVAAINTNRNFIGMELSEKYFNIAKDRINAVIAEKEEQ